MSVWREDSDGRWFVDGEEVVPMRRSLHRPAWAVDYPSGIPGVVMHQEIGRPVEMYFSEGDGDLGDDSEEA